jgi:hypothetical protein
MRFLAVRMIRGVVLCFLTAALPAFPQPPQERSQDRQQRPAARPSPNGQNGRPNAGGPGGGNRPGGRPPADRPGGGGGRPQPSRPNPPRPNPPRPNRPGPNRPPQWGRPPQNRPSYQFRPNDRDFLRRHYIRSLRSINRARRPVFTIGGYFPVGDIGYITAVPQSLYGSIPPPPPGYQMGYYDGYVVVYDPLTYFIANLVDLMQ